MEQDDIRTLVSDLHRKNSDLLRTLWRKQTVFESAQAAFNAQSEGLIAYPEYAGLSVLETEKERLALARLQRRLHRIRTRPKVSFSSIKVPTGSLEPPVAPATEPVQQPHKLLRPTGSFMSDVIYCDCENCLSAHEQEIKADRLWLMGQHDRAASIVRPICLYVMPVGSNALKLRSLRPRVPKGVKYMSKALRATPASQRRDFEHYGVGNAEKDEDPEWIEAEKEIERVERQIRSQVGSADWCAEVVVVVTSLQVAFKAFAAGCRLLRFLEAKGVDHFAIDINADTGRDTLDYRLVRKWLEAGRLHRDPRKVASKVQMTALAPQILVDGVPLGTYEEIVTMEDEGDLDYVLARKACPNCLCNRKPTADDCWKCGGMFVPLICRDYLTSEEITRLLQTNEVNSARIKAPTPRDFERRRRQLGLARLDEDIAAWFTPDRMAKFGVPSIGFTVEFD